MNFKSFFLIIAPFICFTIGYFICSYYLGNQTYPTPDLIGINVHEALLKTSPLHLNLKLIGQKEHPTLAPGTIISQKPIPKRQIKQHQSILITTSTTPGIVLTPNVEKITKAELEDWAQKHSITLQTHFIPSSSMHHRFIAQYPSYNEPIDNQTLIIYYADHPAQLFFMPNLYHQNIQTALSMLDHYDLPVEIFQNNQLIKNIPTSACIITQKPAAGSIINIEKKPTIQLEIMV